MRIAFLCVMPKGTYSGGRYHAWIMAEALAYTGNEVYFITNNIPVFYDDFKEYERHDSIRIILTGTFENCVSNKEMFDYVLIIPSLSDSKGFRNKCFEFSVRHKARMVMINFETPNWFNQYSEKKRKESDMLVWKYLCRHGCMIISSAYESQKFAMEFYHTNFRNANYKVWSPPINTIVADCVHVIKENQIVVMVRLTSEHKGGKDILDLLDENLRGWRIVFIVGSGQVNSAYLDKLKESKKKYGIDYVVKYRLSDYEKFYEIKKSKILLFPSLFEGYGYPPIEAQYCDTQCIAYELPVLRETSNDNLIYCELGDILDMKEKLRKLILEEPQIETKKIIQERAGFEICAEKINFILKDSLEKDEWLNSMMYKYNYNILKFYFGMRSFGRRIKEKYILEAVMNAVKLEEYTMKSGEEEKMEWKDFNSSLKGKKLIVFGYGMGYISFLMKYEKKYNIDYIVDNNEKLWAKKTGGKSQIEIKPPEILREMNRDSFLILITNIKSYREIATQLEEMGIKNYYSFIKMEGNLLPYKIIGKWYRKV